MEVYEKINTLIKEQKLTKRAFSNSLKNLEPKLRTTGEIPSENTIYSYLTGRISIPIELLPYIAEALNITEQELFNPTQKSRKKCFKYFIENASYQELEYFNNFINSQITNNININYGKVIMNNKTVSSNDERVEKCVSLLKYAPIDFMDKILLRLEEYKKLEIDF